MLLRHTPKEVVERKAVMINPAKTCQPIGAMYAALGIHKCLPHSHGSQGCCAYHRSALTRHYKEPVMAGTSSFTEGASVFGGQANLVQAFNNMFSIYNPEVIAVHTTCLSETIGDDVPQIVSKAVSEGKVPEGKWVIHASTPSYVGSHVTGFANMVSGMVKYFSENTGENLNQINILPGYVEPADMAEIKKIATSMGINSVMFPDTSEVLNTPLTGKYNMYPRGGTKVKDLLTTGNSKATVACGSFASGPAAKLLDTKCKVPGEIVDLPIGITGTDNFVDALRKAAGVSVPESITDERGKVVDLMTDMHQYFYNKKVAISGDPDQLIALAQFLKDLGMDVCHVVTGTPGKKFTKRIKEILGEEVNVKNPGDLFLLHQWIKNEPVDLMIGTTHLKYIARDEDIPLVRFGFPIFDRMGHVYFPTVGYTGALRLMEKILDALMDRIDRDAPEEKIDLVM